DASGAYALRTPRPAEAAETVPSAVTPGRRLPWVLQWQGEPMMLLAPLPFVLLLVFCLLLGAWASLARLLWAVVVVGGTLSLLLLAFDAGALGPAQTYSAEGWYWAVFEGVAIVGWVVRPPVLLRWLLSLAGWGGRWVLWVVVPLLLLLMLGFVPLLAMRSSNDPDPGVYAGCLLGALGVAVIGGLLLLGPRFWMRLFLRRAT